MSVRFRILVAVALVAAASSAFALEPSRRVDLYPVDVWREGLPQYTIQAIEQDRDGYLWFGTFEGLVRFNGLRFEVFDEQRVPGLGTSQIRALRRDRNGVLWIGTTGAGVFQVRNGVPAPFRGSRPLPNENVSSMAAARDGSLWVTTRKGVARVRGSQVDVWGPAEGLPHENAIAVAEDSRGSIYVGTDGGLARFDGRRFQLVELDEGGDRQPRILSLAAAADGALWIGTLNGGALRLHGDDLQHYGSAQGLPGGSIATLLQDRDGSIWLGLAPGGLARLRDGRIELLTQQQGLPNDAVRALFEDREGSLWIGTNGGIARLKDLKFVNYARRNGLAEDNVRVVTQTADGAMWVGTYGGGVNRILGGAVSTFGAREGLADLFVRTLAAEAGGTLWVGTGTGLFLIREERVEAVGAGLEGDKIQALSITRDGSLLVVTETGGLQVRRGGRFSPVAIADGERFRTARVLLEDKGGGLWVGTSDRGLFLVENGRIVQQWMTAEGLPGKAVYALHQASDGALWIGARGGLSRLRDRRIRTVTPREGLPQGNVFQVIDDGAGSFWLTSNRGLTRVSIASVQAVMDGRAPRVEASLFTRDDGLASDQCNGATQPAGVRLQNGLLAIPTASGLTLVDPRDLHPNRVAPPVLLTDFLVDARRVDSPAAASLPWDSSRFEFRFDGLSLLVPELVDFRYKLDGFDRQWVDSKRRRFAMYNSLPPGRYTFRVQARNNDGVPSAREARVSFDLPAAPWRRWWAILGYIAVALAAIAALVRFRERALVARTLLLEKRVRQRTADLDAANQRLEALSLTDALTGVANRRNFDAVLSIEWKRACRSGDPLALILVDVDHFKAYNDTYGHQGGDACLRDVAAAMKQTVTRVSDLIARYGGEEFVVLLPSTTPDQANEIAERLRRAVEEVGLPHRTSSAAEIVTISVGVATVTPTLDAAPADLVREADEALYRAKREGRNRVVSATSSLQSRT